jgi:hypothetical protein
MSNERKLNKKIIIAERKIYANGRILINFKEQVKS